MGNPPLFPDDTSANNEFCQFTGSATLTLVGGGLVVTPDVTPSSTVTEAVLFNTQIQSQVSDISRHITGVINGASYFWRPRGGVHIRTFNNSENWSVTDCPDGMAAPLEMCVLISIKV